MLVIVFMELAAYRNSGVLDSDGSSGFLESSCTADAGILQKRRLLG
jgi:hypothetical protein